MLCGIRQLNVAMASLEDILLAAAHIVQNDDKPLAVYGRTQQDQVWLTRLPGRKDWIFQVGDMAGSLEFGVPEPFLSKLLAIVSYGDWFVVTI